jgi:hypothetical protein
MRVAAQVSAAVLAFYPPTKVLADPSSATGYAHAPLAVVGAERRSAAVFAHGMLLTVLALTARTATDKQFSCAFITLRRANKLPLRARRCGLRGIKLPRRANVRFCFNMLPDAERHLARRDFLEHREWEPLVSEKTEIAVDIDAGGTLDEVALDERGPDPRAQLLEGRGVVRPGVAGLHPFSIAENAELHQHRNRNKM